MPPSDSHSDVYFFNYIFKLLDIFSSPKSSNCFIERGFSKQTSCCTAASTAYAPLKNQKTMLFKTCSNLRFAFLDMPAKQSEERICRKARTIDALVDKKTKAGGSWGTFEQNTRRDQRYCHSLWRMLRGRTKSCTLCVYIYICIYIIYYSF